MNQKHIQEPRETHSSVNRIMSLPTLPHLQNLLYPCFTPSSRWSWIHIGFPVDLFFINSCCTSGQKRRTALPCCCIEIKPISSTGVRWKMDPHGKWILGSIFRYEKWTPGTYFRGSIYHIIPVGTAWPCPRTPFPCFGLLVTVSYPILYLRYMHVAPWTRCMKEYLFCTIREWEAVKSWHVHISSPI